ncbi:biotinidase-like isoform X1 [Micropterus dolomieu]|uniref:biotinidase-like isoform X1 n=2 Tax=Micropterus dolomieu TaxID=147949 RepID=UPI001E8E7DE7|nr:biotinidase-like isoform X1 [Micropterus dolomieu]
MSLREETMFLFVFVFIISFLRSAVVQTEPVVDPTYVAAVYEHNVILNPEPRVPLSRSVALQHMQKNLDIYEEQAARAADQGAQILVFPEDGLQGFNFSRSSISGYLETIPDPQQESWNPCTEPGRHNNTEVLQQLSCIARRNNLYLVANMADLQPCPLQTDPSSCCPSDGRWQFNTNVVFRSDGLLVARYHKHNLYFEEAFDTPPQPEIITFDTPFAGRFGLITCFDILFQVPTVTLVEKGVRQLIFPTAWMNQLPLLDTIQYQWAFSLGANVTLLAANIRKDRLIMTGSGIFTPFSATYHHAQRGDPEEGRLLVARVPVLDPLWMGQSVATEEGVVRTESTSTAATGSGFCHQESCFDSHHPESASSVPPSTTTFISTMMYDTFTFVLLKKTEDEVNVCNGTFCCHLQYQRSLQGSGKELYALGAFAGTHIVNGHYALQVCAIVRCAGLDVSSCGQEVEEAESKMDFLLEGNFETRYVYPSVLASRMVLEQPEHLEMALDGRVTMKHSNMSGGLVTACLYGRMYHLDNE